MPRYSAYGLVIEADHPLPLRPAPEGAPVDLFIQFDERSTTKLAVRGLRRELLHSLTGWAVLYVDDDGDWARYDYLVEGKVLRVSSSLDWQLCVSPLVGIVLAVLLRLSGVTLLHGAGLAVRGRAVAILGESGQGKSTLAAALISEGAELLSEDVLRTGEGRGGPLLYAGPMQLSLLEDAHEALRGRKARPEERRAGTDKYWLDCPAAGSDRPPLGAIYLLAPFANDADEPALTRLDGFEAVAGLAANFYGTRWIKAPGAADLAVCGWLARAVPVYRLTRPRSLGLLKDTAKLINDEALFSEDEL